MSTSVTSGDEWRRSSMVTYSEFYLRTIPELFYKRKMDSTPVSASTRSSCNGCKTCDFCLIKKELSRLNQMIICPNKVLSKVVGGEKKKRKVSAKLKEILQPLADIQKQETIVEEPSLL